MPVPLQPANATVGTTSAQILADNPARKGLVINNMSNNTIYLGFGFTAALNMGMALQPGQTYSADPQNLSTSTVNGIADGAGSLLLVQEYI